METPHPLSDGGSEAARNVDSESVANATAAEASKKVSAGTTSATEANKSEDSNSTEATVNIQNSGIDGHGAMMQDQPAVSQDVAAAEGEASSGACGNEFLQTDVANQADTAGDIAMSDVTAGLDRAAAAGDKAPCRKRGASKQREEEPSTDTNASQAPKSKQPRTSRMSSKTDTIKTTNDAPEQTDAIMVDESSEVMSKSAPAKQQPPATRRSGRRAVPTSYKEEDSDAEFNLAPAPSSRMKEVIARASARGVWAPDHLLQDPKSKLVNADLTVHPFPPFKPPPV